MTPSEIQPLAPDPIDRALIIQSIQRDKLNSGTPGKGFFVTEEEITARINEHSNDNN